MRRQPVFQDEKTLVGTTSTSATMEYYQSMGGWLDCETAESVSFDAVIPEPSSEVGLYLETAMSLEGPWVRMKEAVADGESMILSRSAMAEFPLYRYVRWVVVEEDLEPPTDWTISFSMTYAMS